MTSPSAGLSIKAVREALAKQIRTNVDRETNVSAYWLDQPKYPCVMIVPAPGESVAFRTTFAGTGNGGTASLRFTIMVWTTSTDDLSGQIALDDYLSAGGDNQSSIWDALWAGETEGRISLGGLVQDITYISPASYLPPETVDGVRRFGASIPVEILVKKDAVG